MITVSVHQATQSFPASEMYGLSSQLRRAAVSVASNIAEGRGRLNEREFRQLLGVAQGSNCEVQTQILVAKSLGIGNTESLVKAEHLSIKVAKMLSSFIATIES